jgi:SAM-dependent methyltransferase
VDDRTLTFFSALVAWWRRQRRERSALSTFGLLIAIFSEFLRDSLPDHRRQRFGDMDYDWEHRVDTTSGTVGWRTRLFGLLNSPYQPIPAEEFRAIMDSLAVDFRQFTFIDIGSGKGRALLLATEYGFRRIIGIELLPELDRVARENVQKLRVKANIELVCADATEFSFPVEPTVVFFFNPLPESSLRRLVRNIEESLRHNPHAFYVAYANPVLEHTLTTSPLFRKAFGTPHYSVFANSVIR